MGRMNARRFILSVVCWLCVGFIWAADSPVQVILIKHTRGDKGKGMLHFVRLTLINDQDHPVWYVLPFIADKASDPMPKNGVFSYEGWRRPPHGGDGRFGGEVIRAEQGWAVEVTIQNKNFVTAFHLPAKRRVVLDNYCIRSRGQVLKKIDVLEADELKVNGKTPLEKWLPYDSMCSDKEPVDPVGCSMNLDWDERKNLPRDDYPKEKVENVIAGGVRHWEVPFQPKSVGKTQ